MGVVRPQRKPMSTEERDEFLEKRKEKEGSESFVDLNALMDEIDREEEEAKWRKRRFLPICDAEMPEHIDPELDLDVRYSA